jgi:hypothetical protein
MEALILRQVEETQVVAMSAPVLPTPCNQIRLVQDMIRSSSQNLEDERQRYVSLRSDRARSPVRGSTPSRIDTLRLGVSPAASRIGQEMAAVSSLAFLFAPRSTLIVSEPQNTGRLVQLLTEIQRVVERTEQFYLRQGSRLLRPTSNMLPPSWLVAMQKECHQLLDGNRRVALQLQQLGQDMSKVPPTCSAMMPTTHHLDPWPFLLTGLQQVQGGRGIG